jgi:hypothetical protein
MREILKYASVDMKKAVHLYDFYFLMLFKWIKKSGYETEMASGL